MHSGFTIKKGTSSFSFLGDWVGASPTTIGVLFLDICTALALGCLIVLGLLRSLVSGLLFSSYFNSCTSCGKMYVFGKKLYSSPNSLRIIIRFLASLFLCAMT